MITSIARLLTASAAIVMATTSGADSQPTVAFPNGATISGTTETNIVGGTVNVFRGIPYAVPPVGEHRWKPSTLQPLTGNINATNYGSVCVMGQSQGSEDCLFLNVFAPPGATRESKLPVMVWIHGGGFMGGSSNNFDGANLLGAADNKIVYVSLNYRVGFFGFFSNRQILAEGGGANFGLQDQEVAFAWIKEYIEHFGGNPEDITAFGESAGSMSIAMHMIARDGDQKLFKRAIMESGTYTTTHDTHTPETQENDTHTIAKAVGCDSAADVLKCLRQVNTSTIFGAGGAIDWKPTVDGVFMKDVPIRRLLAGKVSRVPTILGTNANEGWTFTMEQTNSSQYDSFVRNRFPLLNEAEFARLAELYPVSSFLTPHHRAAEIFGDAIFVCPTEQFSYTLGETAEPLTHHYYFNFTSTEYGYPLVVHAKDHAFVFNRVASLANDDDTKRVVKYFQTYWTNFAITGSPNGYNAAQSVGMVWPRFNGERQQLVIQPQLKVETNGVNLPNHLERCAFWLDIEKRVTSDVSFA